MNLNPIALVFIALLVVLMLVVAHHATDRHNQIVAAGTSDPLIQAIEEHNKLQQKEHFSIPYTVPGTAAYTGNTGFPAYLQRNGQPANPGVNPYVTANPYHMHAIPSPQQPAPAPQNSYYPPPPVGTPQPPRSDIELDRNMQQVLPFVNLPGQSAIHLASGQRIAFVGTAAYALDAKGRPTPLPDGRYPLYNGRLTITIRDGHKVIN